MADDPLADFKDLLTSHARVMNVQRDKIARSAGGIVAASGNEPIKPVDIVVAMARIDSLLDSYYGKDSDLTTGILYNIIVQEAGRAEQLAKDQSNAIIDEELKDHPELIPLVRIE